MSLFTLFLWIVTISMGITAATYVVLVAIEIVNDNKPSSKTTKLLATGYVALFFWSFAAGAAIGVIAAVRWLS